MKKDGSTKRRRFDRLSYWQIAERQVRQNNRGGAHIVVCQRTTKGLARPLHSSNRESNKCSQDDVDRDFSTRARPTLVESHWHLCDSARSQKIGWRTLTRANGTNSCNPKTFATCPDRNWVAAHPAEETFFDMDNEMDAEQVLQDIFVFRQGLPPGLEDPGHSNLLDERES